MGSIKKHILQQSFLKEKSHRNYINKQRETVRNKIVAVATLEFIRSIEVEDIISSNKMLV